MTHSWDGYKDVAENLNKFGVDNYFRSAVSRAYYYAFNIGVEHLKAHGKYTRFNIPGPNGATRKASVHESLSLSIEQLGHSYEALSLSNMRLLRNRCDYDHRLPIVLDKARVDQVIADAEILVDFFRRTFP